MKDTAQVTDSSPQTGRLETFSLDPGSAGTVIILARTAVLRFCNAAKRTWFVVTAVISSLSVRGRLRRNLTPTVLLSLREDL